ncbi:MAG: histidinol-phosphate aminotransferase family protein [Candidatus Cloacimonetes bacterium]|nr:histidinol-phosphate aminotransferase family protein [Candidatus Cloacimonadota bacterium]
MGFFRSDLEDFKPVNITVPRKKIMLCLNEGALDPFPILQEEILRKMKQIHLNRYFNPVSAELRAKLADYAQVPADCLALGNGADEMLYYVFTAVREDSSTFAISLSPSYFDYKSYCQAVGLGIRFLHLDKNFDFQVEDFLKLGSSPDCKLAILCNPNNPTGNLFSSEKIREILTSFPGLVLLDETYYEFSGVTFKDYLDEFENLLIVRSFSKSFSAAGLRFGYLLSHPRNIAELEKVMTAFHLNIMTQAIVTVMIDNRRIFAEYVQQVITERNRMYHRLALLPDVKVFDSATNFLLFTLGDKSRAFFNFITDCDIAIRPVWQHPLLSDCLRVSVGSPDQNDLFLQRIEEFTS